MVLVETDSLKCTSDGLKSFGSTTFVGQKRIWTKRHCTMAATTRTNSLGRFCKCEDCRVCAESAGLRCGCSFCDAGDDSSGNDDACCCETSAAVREASWAAFNALLRSTRPTCLPSAPTKRTVSASICSFMRAFFECPLPFALLMANLLIQYLDYLVFEIENRLK